jgi:hypothetical protein
MQEWSINGNELLCQVDGEKKVDMLRHYDELYSENE